MKKLLFVVALGAFAACNSGENKAAGADTTAKVDTAKAAVDTTAKVAVDTTKKDTTAKK